MYDKEMEPKVEKMREFSRFEGTEIGETWSFLANAWNDCQESYVSEEFASALKKEVERQTQDIEGNWRIQERTQERTVKETFNELIYIEDQEE